MSTSRLQTVAATPWSVRGKSAPPIKDLTNLPRYAYQFFFREAGPFKGIFYALTLGGSISAALKFASVFILGRIITDINRLSVSEIFTLYLPLCIAAIGIAEILDYFTRKYSEALPSVFSDYTSLRFYRTLLGWNSHRLTNVSKERLSALISRYITHVEHFLSSWVWALTRNATSFVIVLGVLYYQDPRVLLLALGYMLFFLVVSLKISSRFAPYAAALSEQSIRTQATTQSFVLNLNTFRQMNRAEFFISSVQSLLTEKWWRLHRLRGFHARRWLLQLNLFNTLYLGTIFYGVYQVKLGTLPIGFLLLLKYSFDRLWDILVFIVEYYVELVQQRVDSEIVNSSFTEFAPTHPDSDKKRSLGDWKLIELSNIRIEFAGGDSTPPVCIQVPQLTLRKGERIGIIGVSGIGKSTILNLLRNTIPFEGSYSIDGDTVLSGRSEIQGVSMITSSDPLFKLSLRDNILLGRTVEPSLFNSILEGLAISEFVDDLDQVVGDPDFHLSGGQEQRIRLARGLISPAELVLLDEAFSALDESTKMRVLGFVQSFLKDTTIVMVTHDPEDLILVDKQYTIVDGVLAFKKVLHPL